MNEIKTDLFPEVLRAGKKDRKEDNEQQTRHTDSHSNEEEKV